MLLKLKIKKLNDSFLQNFLKLQFICWKKIQLLANSCFNKPIPKFEIFKFQKLVWDTFNFKLGRSATWYNKC